MNVLSCFRAKPDHLHVTDRKTYPSEQLNAPSEAESWLGQLGTGLLNPDSSCVQPPTIDYESLDPCK